MKKNLLKELAPRADTCIMNNMNTTTTTENFNGVEVRKTRVSDGVTVTVTTEVRQEDQEDWTTFMVREDWVG